MSQVPQTADGGLHTDTTLDAEPPEGYQLTGYDLPKLRSARRVHPNPEFGFGRSREDGTNVYPDGTTVITGDDDDMSVTWGGVAMVERFVGDFGPDHPGSPVCSLFRVAYNTHTSMLTVDIIKDSRSSGLNQRVEARVELDTQYVDDPHALCEALAEFGRYPHTGVTNMSAGDVAETLTTLYENGTADALKRIVEGNVFDALA